MNQPWIYVYSPSRSPLPPPSPPDSSGSSRKRDTDVQNRILDSVGGGEGGMFRENSIETCILSVVKITAQVGYMRQVLGPGALGRPKQHLDCFQI